VPKVLFYAGTAFCLFLALSAAVESSHELQSGAVSFVALRAFPLHATANAPWAIVVALLAGVAAAGILLRMAALLAARNLFAAFLALASVAGAVISLTWLSLLQARMLPLLRDAESLRPLGELHFAALMMLGYFVSLAMLALRPYFRIQASRVLSALVFFPLPLFLLMLAQELFTKTSLAPLPARTPASLVLFSVYAVLFFAIAVHSIRHRHLFLEMTNLRELLDSRVDPAGRGRRTLGGVAFDV
jgi:hypothetical protein